MFSRIKNTILFNDKDSSPSSYTLIAEYIKDPATGSEISIYKSEKVIRKIPFHENNEVQKEFIARQSYLSSHQKVYLLKNVRFWGFYGGTIVTPSNKLLAELSPDVWGVESHTIFTKLKLPPCTYLTGRTAILSTPEASANYFHWTFDLLPRLHLILKGGTKIDTINYFIVNHRNLNYQFETLKQLGIPSDKIIKCDAKSHFSLEEAIVPNLCPSNTGIASWKIDFLRSLQSEHDDLSEGYSKIYISRQRSRQRKFLNGDAVEEILIERGFQPIFLEDYTVSRQRSLFYNARYILGIHGAGLSNIVYCKKGTKLIEIFPPNFIQPYYWFIVDMIGLNYDFLVGEDIGNHKGSYSHLIAEDVLLDLEKLEGKLQGF